MDDLGDFGHPNDTSAEDDLLRYLLSDSPPSLDSTPDSSPPHMFEDSTPDASPSHWSQELRTPPVVPQLSELSLDLNPELLFGSNSEFGTFLNAPLSGAPETPPKELTQPIVPTYIPQSVVPIVQPIAIVQPPQHVQVPIVVEPPSKKNRISGKKRKADVPSVPSPQDKVALPRDTLLNITSQSMERYVETLQSTRHLSNDDQKELKRQKRLIKNRESAQLSRERKRAYIDQLEAKIAELVAEAGQLKTDNSTLRETLARYNVVDPTVKPEPSQDVLAQGRSAAHQISTKMGSLLQVGTRTTATAGVCLLIVLFSFGLFMNVNNKPAMYSRLGQQQQGLIKMDVNSMFDSAITPVEVGMRSLLETIPDVEVKDEENDTEPYEPVGKFPKALPFETTSSPSSKNMPTTNSHRHIIRLAGRSTSTPNAFPNRTTQQKIEINKAGVFTVSYSPDAASFNGEHAHGEGSNNSTFMLFLDPRPDLEDDGESENTSAPVSATHETQLQVASHTHKKRDTQLPPMIISLVFPEDFANGSNPLLLPEGLNAANSLMEITCQVVDISITTSEQPPQTSP